MRLHKGWTGPLRGDGTSAEQEGDVGTILLVSCEKVPTESADTEPKPFPTVGPGEFALEIDGAVTREVTGDAVFYHPWGSRSRTVLLTGRGGYPEMSFDGGLFGPSFAFPAGRHSLDPTLLLIIAALQVSPADGDRYMGRAGYVNVRESTADRVVGEFEFAGSGPAPGDVRVRGAFHALREE